MTKPISEPTPALESANYGWRIRQLERRPTPMGSPWCQCTFSGSYFASGTYPTWNWSSPTLADFFTNAPELFSLGTNVINIPAGIYVGNVKLSYTVNGQFLDLPPQAGTTRTHPGCLLSEIWLTISGYLPLKDWFSESKEDYDLSALLSGGLGTFIHEVAGFVTAQAPTTASVFFKSYSALIGPNNTGSFPATAPAYGGRIFLERINDYPEPA